MNIAHLLTRAARAAADHVAVARGDRPVWTYGALAARVAALAGGLRRRHGLAPGDRVALLMTNAPDYVVAVFACWHAGLTAVPINSKLHAREIAYILDHGGARLLIATPDRAAAAAAAVEASEGKPAVVETGTADHARLLAGEALAPHAAAPDDTAWLFYTSGTTGRPKGAMLTHRNLLAMTANYFVDVDRVEPGDAILHAAPMTHGSGCYMLAHVAGMAANVIPESGGFDPAEMFALIRAWPGASFFAAPTLVHRLTLAPEAGDADTRNLKTLVYGGGPMYREDCKRALALFGPKLAQIYGQGESPMTITVLPKRLHADIGHPRYEERLASVGYAQGVVEVMVAGDGDRPLPPGGIGEVLVRGDTVMAGYWRDPEATAQTLRGGWLHTGDLGAMDEDGFLTLKDRSKDLIISGGVNIYPREIEEVLLTHEAVAEVAVVGRPHPDWGEEVVAVVVPLPGRTVDPASLDALCGAHIARFKRPKHYRIVEALPKNHYGKVLKTQLRADLV
ncbi:AMP-binding protein [Azospirillum sp.]|uniref:AMP-binding protein n=1 Tax=Azospirillum sp. TaxID=34012 RepID=UPI002D682D09|nr:AMP-binding protein [Azospirillum sp.]HYD66842.1 AMP-binding protein [Azospirillum sp.]